MKWLRPPHLRNRCLRRLASGEETKQRCDSCLQMLRVIISKNELFCIILPYSSDFVLRWEKFFFQKNPFWTYTPAPPTDFPLPLSIWGAPSWIPGTHGHSSISQCYRGQGKGQQRELPQDSLYDYSEDTLIAVCVSHYSRTAPPAFKLTLPKEIVWMPPLWETLWDVLPHLYVSLPLAQSLLSFFSGSP